MPIKSRDLNTIDLCSLYNQLAKSCPKYKAVSDICNAAVGTVHIWSCQITISIDILQMHDGVSITPHTVPLSCVVLFIIAQQKMVCSLLKLR